MVGTQLMPAEQIGWDGFTNRRLDLLENITQHPEVDSSFEFYLS